MKNEESEKEQRVRLFLEYLEEVGEMGCKMICNDAPKVEHSWACGRDAFVHHVLRFVEMQYMKEVIKDRVENERKSM